jgi:hypothetical protein
MEHGELLQIGEKVKNVFENIRIEDTLIFDWMIESDEKSVTKSYMVDSDEVYNYYVVDEQSVKGYYDGEKIVPYKNFIFLKNIPAIERGEKDELTGMYIEKTASGVIRFVEWKDNPNDVALQVEEIKKQIDSLNKSRRTPEVQKKLNELTQEMNSKNRKLQKKTLLPYKVAYSNKIIDRNFGFKLKEDDIVYCDNWACRYITNFRNKEYSYIICPIDNIGFLYDSKPKITGETFALQAMYN